MALQVTSLPDNQGFVLRYVSTNALTLFSLCYCQQASVDSGFVIKLCHSAEETTLQEYPHLSRQPEPSESA